MKVSTAHPTYLEHSRISVTVNTFKITLYFYFIDFVSMCRMFTSQGRLAFDVVVVGRGTFCAAGHLNIYNIIRGQYTIINKVSLLYVVKL